VVWRADGKLTEGNIGSDSNPAIGANEELVITGGVEVRFT